MIELLVKYIQDKGYIVHVLPGHLLIQKIIGDQQLCLGWAISQIELASLSEELLYYAADERLKEFIYVENFIDKFFAKKEQ